MKSSVVPVPSRPCSPWRFCRTQSGAQRWGAGAVAACVALSGSVAAAAPAPGAENTAGAAPVASDDTAEPQTEAPSDGPSVGPAEPDPALVERNRKLTLQNQEGERWLIGGRVGAGVGALFSLVGVGMLVGHGIRKRKFEDDAAAYIADPTANPVPTPVGRGLAAGGAVLLVAGLGGVGVSAWAIHKGGRLTRSARDGQLSLMVGQHHAGLSLTGRF